MAGQQLARDEAGHIWEVDANGQPIRLHTPAPAARPGGIYSLPPTPMSAADLAAKGQEARIRALQIKKMQDEASGSNGGLEPATIDMIAHQYILSGQLPALGMGASAAADRRAILNRVSQVVGVRSGESLQVGISRYKNGVKALGNLENQLGTISTNEGTASANAEQYLSAIRKVFPQDSWAIGNAARAIERKFVNDPDYTAYDTARNTFLTEYAKVVAGTPTGAGTLSDSARREQMDVLRSTTSPAAAEAAITQMRADMRNRIGSYQTNIQRGYSNLEAGRSVGATSNGDLVDERGAIIPPSRDPTPTVPGAVPGSTTPPGAPPPGNTPPPSATLGPRPGSPLGGPDRSADPNSLRPDAGPGAGPGGTSIEKGSTEHFSTVQDRAYQSALQGAFNKGATREQIQGLAAKFGYPPLGADLDAAISYRDKGGHGAAIELPQSGSRPLSLGEQANNAFADSGVGTGAIHAGLAVGALPNGVTRLAGRALGFNGDMRQAFGNPDQNDAVMSYLDAQHHPSAIAGDLIGGVAGAGGLEALAAKGLLRAGVGEGARSVAAPLIGDAAFGGLQGAGNAQQGDELQGALIGGLAGAGGGAVGRKIIGPAVARALQPLAASRPVMATGNAVRGMFGRAPAIMPEAPTVAQQQLLRGVNPDVIGQLDEAALLRVPMSPADTSPAMTSLGGAVIRRSPTARQVAEDAFLPRSRGQIDRFGNAVTRDLGPVANIPQRSADLTEQARSAAAPLYDKAYAAPGASTVSLEDLLPRPSMRSGMSRAYRIAQEEGRDPTALGFDLNAAGEPTLTRVPSFQSLDYLKRGIDDSLEPHRNLLTGKLALNEDTRAINGTRATLLGRIDAANPDYAAARAAYAGPTQARDAMARGADAFKLSPDELAFQVGQQTPEHLSQMQLGFRSEMMNRANNVRDASNPFESVLGSPAARGRIDALYPGNNENLFRTRDLEQQLARSQNSILGNSATAERTLADKAMAAASGLVPAGGADLALMGLHAPPVATLGYLAAKGVKAGVQRVADRRIASVADELAPTLFNTNPAQASATLSDLLNSSQAYRDFVAGQRRKIANGAGMFGAGAGSAGASLLEH